MRYRATKFFWLGDEEAGRAIRIEAGDLLDWDGESAAVFKTQKVIYPEVDSFNAAIKKGLLVESADNPELEGWDVDPLE